MINKKKWEELDALFKKSVSAQFTEEERKVKETVISMYNKAQLKCKRNKVESGLIWFRRADCYYQKYNFNAKQKMYINMYIYPNIAYKFYKLEDYENAFKYIYKSIACLSEIEKEFKFINFTKIHQAHNLIRLFYTQKRYDAYFEWNHYILNFLVYNEVPKSDNKVGLSIDLIPLVAGELVATEFNQIFLEKIVNLNITHEIPYEAVSFFDPFIKKKNKIDREKFKIFHYFIECLSTINHQVNDGKECIADKLLNAIDDSDYLYVKILLYVHEIRKQNQLKNKKDIILIEHIQKKIQIALKRIKKKKHFEAMNLKLFKSGILRASNKSGETNKLELVSVEKTKLPKRAASVG